MVSVVDESALGTTFLSDFMRVVVESQDLEGDSVHTGYVPGATNWST